MRGCRRKEKRIGQCLHFEVLYNRTGGIFLLNRKRIVREYAERGGEESRFWLAGKADHKCEQNPEERVLTFLT